MNVSWELEWYAKVPMPENPGPGPLMIVPYQNALLQVIEWWLGTVMP